MSNFLSQALGFPAMSGVLYPQTNDPFIRSAMGMQAAGGINSPAIETPNGPSAPNAPQADPAPVNDPNLAIAPPPALSVSPDTIDTGSFKQMPNKPSLWGSDATSGRALLALGAGILGGRGFFDGLSKGITGYQQALDTDRELNTPQVTPLASGAVMMTRDPRTGRVSYSANKPVQDYNMGVANALGQRQLTLQGVKGEQAKERNNETIDARRDIASQASQDRIDIAKMMSADRAQARADMMTFRMAMLAQQGDKSPRAAALAKHDVDEQFSAMDAAKQAGSDLDTYSRLEGLAKQAGVGSGVVSKAERALAAATGVSTPHVDADALSQFRTEIGNLRVQAGQMLKGQGQVSDAERRMLDASLPNMESSYKAFTNVMRVMRAAKQRQIDTYNGFVQSGNPSWSSYMGTLPQTYGNGRSQGPSRSSGQSSSGVKWRIVN